MPLYNWIKCTEGDLTHVRKTKEGNANNDIEAWTKVHDSYIEEFGLSEHYKKMLQVMKQKALYEADYVLTGNRFKLTEAEIQAGRRCAGKS